MAWLIEKCPNSDWFENFQKIDSEISGEHPFFPSNIFFSQQYFGLEIFQKSFRQSYVLKNSGFESAWLMAYALSDRVIRLRGVFVVPELRGKRLGQELIRQVLNIYKNHYQRAALFVPTSTVEFYRKCGFEISPDFSPRKIEYFNPLTKLYDLEQGELFYLMIKDLSKADETPS